MNDLPDTDRLELLITRRLDGCTHPADEAELNRLLGTSSHAREIWRQTAAIDAMAADALKWAGSQAAKPRHAARPRVLPQSHAWPQVLFRFGAIGALAASIMFAIVMRPGETANPPSVAPPPTPSGLRAVAFPPVEIAPAEVMRDLTSPCRHHRRTDCGRIGIIRGDRLYLMSVDHDEIGAAPVRADL